MIDKSKVPALAYSSMLEMLAERYHASPKLLLRLNPNVKWRQGENITVPNVIPFTAPTSKSAKPEDTTDTAKNRQAGVPRTAETATTGNIVVVTDKTKTLTVQTAGGDVRFYAPVTTGSEKDPLPVGEWEVTGVSFNPTFNYNPELFWDANPKDAKAKIPPGPNNPVGVVWIDLNKPHYGIHGTPEPARVGYTESHGCIRLTNWDAMRVAALVGPATKVILK
jgi:lipoprotein-anchoring transpeptidase ErfK/SrfK